MKTEKRKWPLRIALALIFLNADALLFGLIYFDITSPFKAFLIALCISIPEIPIWYLALNRLFLDYVVPAGEKAVEDAKESGYFYWDSQYWVNKFNTIRNPISWHNKFILRVIKILGFYGLFIISSEPLPFGRTITILSCVVARSPLGLLPISIGNVIHLYGASMIWDKLFQ